MKVSLVIPLYKQEHLISSTLKRLSVVCKTSNFDYEILICDDGSPSQDQNSLHFITKQYSHTRLYFNNTNKGLGFTLRKLFLKARGDAVIYLDCDLPFGEDIISVLRTELEFNDIVVASRYRNFPNNVSYHRKLFSRLYCWFCRWLFKIQINDIGSGTVALRREIIPMLKLKADRFEIHAEIYQKAYSHHLRIKEIGAKSFRTQSGSFSVIRHGPGIVFDTLRLWVGCLKRVKAVNL